MKNIINIIIYFLIVFGFGGCNDIQLINISHQNDSTIIELDTITQQKWNDLLSQIVDEKNKKDFIFFIPQRIESQWMIGLHTFFYDLDGDDIEDFREEFLIFYDNNRDKFIETGQPFYYCVNNNKDELYSPLDNEILIDPKRDGINGNETIVTNEGGYLIEIDYDKNLIIYEGKLDESNNPDFKRDNFGNPIIFYKENLEREEI